MATPSLTVEGLNWDQPYLTTKSLVIQVTDQGQLAANNSVSRTPQVLSPHLFVVLSCFLQSTTPRQALLHLQEEEWDVDEAEFEVVVGRMIRLNFLTPIHANGHGPEVASAETALAEGGFASVFSHQVMLRDLQRVLTYKSAIFCHAAGQDVLEIGCGTGILSIFAAQAQARRVIAIEESEIAHVAEQMFAANDVADRLTLIRGNSRDIVLDEPVDVIIHELIGSDPFGENMLVYLADARRRFLRPGGRLLPGRLEVCCVGYEADDKTQILQEAGEFAGLYGVNFAPFIEALAATASPARFGRTITAGPMTILTEECRLYDIDFNKDFSAAQPAVEAWLPVKHRGVLGGVEVFFRAHFDESTQLTNGPFLGTTHWRRLRFSFNAPKAVLPGETVGIVARLETHLSRQRLVVEPKP